MKQLNPHPEQNETPISPSRRQTSPPLDLPPRPDSVRPDSSLSTITNEPFPAPPTQIRSPTRQQPDYTTSMETIVADEIQATEQRLNNFLQEGHIITRGTTNLVSPPLLRRDMNPGLSSPNNLNPKNPNIKIQRTHSDRLASYNQSTTVSHSSGIRSTTQNSMFTISQQHQQTTSTTSTLAQQFNTTTPPSGMKQRKSHLTNPSNSMNNASSSMRHHHLNPLSNPFVNQSNNPFNHPNASASPLSPPQSAGSFGSNNPFETNMVLPSPGPTVRQRISNWMKSADGDVRYVPGPFGMQERKMK